MHEYPNIRRQRQRRADSPSRALPQRGPRSSNGKATVITVVDPALRSRIDGATDGAFNRVHVDSVTEALRAVREHSAQAVLLSPAMVCHQPLADIHRLVVKSPGVTAVAVVSDGEVASETLLDLGACGVRQLLSLNGRAGWDRLRGLLDHGGGATEPVILGKLLPLLDGATDGSRHFFALLVRSAPNIRNAKALAMLLKISPSTLFSRFFRASLPAPRTYLAMTRLLYASAFLETKETSLAAVADSLNYSSPQSFGRHIRIVLGMPPGEFRRTLPFAAALDHFTRHLVVPYQATFRRFDPITQVPVVQYPSVNA